MNDEELHKAKLTTLVVALRKAEERQRFRQNQLNEAMRDMTEADNEVRRISQEIAGVIVHELPTVTAIFRQGRL